MRILFTNSTLNIKDGVTVSGVSNRRETLNVLQGRVWVTIEGSPDDYWLAAGDSFVVEPGKLVVIEAYRGDGQVLLSPEQEIDQRDGEPRRAFDFLRATSANRAKQAQPALQTTSAVQIGYTDGLCQQQKPQARPQQQATA
jgi:hypothetical protein